jgi:hypothetical protein
VSVIASCLSVDPSITERCRESLGLRLGFHRCGLLGELDPHPIPALMVSLEPSFPRRPISEFDDRKTAFVSATEADDRSPVAVFGRCSFALAAGSVSDLA